MIIIIRIMWVIMLMPMLTACNSSKGPEGIDVSQFEQSTYDILNQLTDVVLEVKEKTVTPDTEEITLICTNHSDKEYFYGEDFDLEMEIEGVWYADAISVLPNSYIRSIAYILPPNGKNEPPFHIKRFYDKLEAGKYRIIKTFNAEGQAGFVIAEFEVQE